MKSITIILFALTLTGCSTLDKVELPAGQALLVAEAATDGANHTATIAATSGLLKGDAARKVKAAVDAGNNAVSAAHSLYAKGDIPGAIGQLNTALADVAAIQAAAKAP